MANMHTQSENTLKDKKNFNGWKWAFITFVVLIVGGLIYLSYMLQPVSVNDISIIPNDRRDEQVVLTTSINRQDTETIMNTYLNESIGEDFSDFFVSLTDQLEIHGELEVFKLNVPFSLKFLPYALENGNVQLKGESVQLANFNLPVSSVMSLLTQQMVVPDFIAIDSANQLVVINLNEMTKDFTFDISVEAINLVEDEIRLKLLLDKDMISDSIQTVN